MADQATAAAQPAPNGQQDAAQMGAPMPKTRDGLEKLVKQQVMLSMGLKYEEKEQLLGKLKTLSDDQLKQLKGVFDAENQRKQTMLSDFFSEHPDLYPEFERFSKEHVGNIYREVEDGEKTGEDQRLEQLLQTAY